MIEQVDQLLVDLDRQVEKVAECQDFVTSLSLTQSELKRKLAEAQNWAELAVIKELGGYQENEPYSTINEKALGSNAETRARTMTLELARARDPQPEIDRYWELKTKLQSVESDLAYQQDELRKQQDMLGATKWKLRVYLADKLADTEISREVLPF